MFKVLWNYLFFIASAKYLLLINHLVNNSTEIIISKPVLTMIMSIQNFLPLPLNIYYCILFWDIAFFIDLKKTINVGFADYKIFLLVLKLYLVVEDYIRSFAEYLNT